MKRVRKNLCRRLISGISAFVMALTMMTFALPQSVFAATTDDIGSINVKFNWVHTGVPETGEAHNLGGGEVVIEYFTGDENTWNYDPVTKQAATFGYNQSSMNIDLRSGYDYIKVFVDNRTLGYLDKVTKIDDSHYEITMTYASKQYTAKQSWIDTTSTVTVPETTFDIEMLVCGRGWRSIMLDKFVRWDEEDAARVKQMLSTFVVRKTVPAHNKNEETTVVWNLPAYYCGQVTSSILYKVVQDDVSNYYTKSPTIITNPEEEKTDWDFVNINTKSTTDLPVKKIWLDEGYENKRPSSVTVGIYNKNNMNTPVKTITMSSADATDAHTWQKNVTLPMVDTNGELIEYRLKENELPNYKTTYDASEKEGYYLDFDKFQMFESGFGVNVVRTDEHGNQVIYSPNSYAFTTFMEGATKDDVGHGDTTFTGKVKLYNDMLYQGVASYTTREWERAGSHFYYDGKDIIETRHPFEQGDAAIYEYRLSENSDERLVFVMNTQSWGDYYGFKIKEISPIGNEDTIVNRYINVPIDIPFEKKWDDAGHEDKRPASIEFDLYRNGEKIKSKTVTASNNWKGSFSGEMKYDDNGKEYAYVVREGKAIAKDGNVYKTTYTKPDEPYFNALEIKFKDFRDSELSDSNGFPEIYFSDEDGWWKVKHHSLTTHYIDGLIIQVPATNFVLRSSSAVDSFIVQAEYIKPIHLDENLQSLYANCEKSYDAPSQYSYHQCYYSTTPKDLPLIKFKRENGGSSKAYYWRFELEDGYAVTEGEKTVATNKYETIDFPVNKYWNVKDVSTIPVSEVEFELVNAKNPDKVIRTLTVTNQNKQSAPSAYLGGEVWTGTFEGLPKYNSDGTLAVYQVREKSQIDGFIADTVNAPIVGTSPYAGAWITLETDTEQSRIPYIYINSAGGEVRYQDIVVSDMNKQKFFVPYNYGTNFDFRLYQLNTNADLKVTSYELTTEMPDRDKMNNIYFYSLNLQTPSEEYLIADYNIQYIVDGNKIYRNKKDISYSDKAYFNYLGEYNTEEEIRNKVGNNENIYDLTVDNGLSKLHRSKYARDITYNSAYDYYLIDGKSIPMGSKKFSLQPYGNEENNIGKFSAADTKIPIHSVVNSPKKVELKVNKVWDYSKANKSNRNIGAVTFQVVNKKNPDAPIDLILNNGLNVNNGANIKANTFALINPYLIDKMKATKNGTAFTKTPDDYVNVPWNSIYSVMGQGIPVVPMKEGNVYFLDNLIGDMFYDLPYMNSDGTKAEYLVKELTVTYMDNAEVADTAQKDLADTVTETSSGAEVTKNISNITPEETNLTLTKEWEIVKTAISTDNIGGAVFEIYNKKDLNTPLTFYYVNQYGNEQIQCSSVMLINPYFVDKSLHSVENGQIVEYTKTPQDFKNALWTGQYMYYVPKSNSAQEIKTFLTDLDANPVVSQPYQGYVPTLQANFSVRNGVLVPSLNADGTRAEYVIKEKKLVDMQGNQIDSTDFLLLSSEQITKQGDIEVREVSLKNTDDTTINLSFTKVWAGDSDFKARPAKLTFKAYNKNDTEFKNPVQSIEVNTTNDTRKVYTFSGLPKYNDDSTLAEYVVREDAVSKYTTSYSADGLTVTNTRKYGKILLVKDNEGSKIAGTQFGIYSNSTCTKLVSTITTDEQGVARSGKLEYGTYYVKETKAIDGYTISRAVYKATINSNGICYITKASNVSTKSFKENLTGVTAIENKQNRLEISKVDTSDEHTLEGAVLALYNSSGEEIERWTTTNEQKVFKGLSYGNYTIKELKAPKGYNTAEDIKVTITEDTETLSVKMYDEKGIEMPETGGAGRTGVYVISLILLLAGTIYLVHSKKAEKE